jgi:hypothetical protein
LVYRENHQANKLTVNAWYFSGKFKDCLVNGCFKSYGLHDVYSA